MADAFGSQAGGPARADAREAGGLAGIATGLTDEIAQLDRELDEVALLAGQATTEAERQEGRRVKADERVTTLERDPVATATEIRDARVQLLSLSRRAMLFDTQRDVLEGKLKTLQRYRDRLAWLLEALSRVDPDELATVSIAPAIGSGRPAGGVARPSEGDRGRRPGEAAAVLRAQEDLRRDIARQMHDGPAQSLANIALQSEIVERLVTRRDPRAATELGSLRQMVQSTLAQTKDFIFDVRPMVLDDLGLVPTLRRTAVDRGQRSGVEIDFDSSGTDRRLSADLESGIFRILDDAIAGYMQLRPARITARLDWSDDELSGSVRGHWQAPAEQVTLAPLPTERRQELPPALAAMIEQKETEERLARAAARSLPPARVQEIEDRAAAMGAVVQFRDEGQALEVAVRIA